MKEMDNVCEETTLTGDIAEAKEKNAPTVLGKFKDVDALQRAYESLQAEFTRRSQRLRELEKEVDNFTKGSAVGVEKLRKTAKARREEAKEFDAFVADTVAPKDKKPTDEVEPVETDESSVLAKEERFLGVDVKMEEAQAADGEKDEKTDGGYALEETRERGGESAAITQEELFRRANEDETVRLRIVGEYLASLGKSGAPLTANGVGMLAAPSARAKSVGEAGSMALLYFRKAIEG